MSETPVGAETPLTLEEIELVAFDVETTGLYPERGDRIVEIGAVRFNLKGDEIETFATLINPGRPVGDSVNIHGITDLELVSAPDEYSALDSFTEFLSNPAMGWKPTTLLAHNAKFDRGFLLEAVTRLEVSRFGIDGKPATPTVMPFVCTMLMARRHIGYGQSKSLANLALRYGIPTGTSHRALDDARTAMNLFMTFATQRREIKPGIRTLNELVTPGEWV